MTTLPIPSERLSETDYLGRSRFAKLLLGVLSSVDVKHGTVVGVTGPWGSGKSWLLEQARTLDSAERESGTQTKAETLHWVTFNPWMLSGSEALMESMLVEIAEQLAIAPSLSQSYQHGRAIAKSVFTLAATVGKARHLLTMASGFFMATQPALAIPLGAASAGMEAAASLAEKAKKALEDDKETASKGTIAIKGDGALKGLSLAKARLEVIEALKHLEGRIVVVIDDLDRTSPKEVAEILQAVKAVAEFPRVVYLLAYDPTVVARGLEQALNIRDGIAYLEKIVQVPLALPDPSFMKLRSSGLAMVADVKRTLRLDGDGERVGESERDNEPSERLELAVALMRSPRDVVRWRTLLYMVLPHLSDELDFDDVVLVLALQHKAPEVVEYLNEYRSYFFEASHLAHDAVRRRAGHIGRMPEGLADGFLEAQELRFRDLRAIIGKLRIANDLVDSSLKALRIAPEVRLEPDKPEPLRLWLLANWMRLRSLTKDSDLEDTSDLVAMIVKPSIIANSPHIASAQSIHMLLSRLMPLLDQPRLFTVAAPDLPGLAAVMSATLAKFGPGCRTEDEGRLWPAAHIRNLFVASKLDDQVAILGDLISKDHLLDETGLLLRAVVRPPTWRMGSPAPAFPERFEPVRLAWLKSAQRYINQPDEFLLSDSSPFAIAQRMVELGEPADGVRASIEAAMLDCSVERLRHWLSPQNVAEISLGVWTSVNPERPTVAFLAALLGSKPEFVQQVPDFARILESCDAKP